MPRPLALLGVSFAFLALALACGGGSEPDPADVPTTPSLGDLLGAEPSTLAGVGGDASAQAPLPEQLPDLVVPQVQDEPEPQETPECSQARAELRAEREGVDARRGREIAAAERSLASGQLAMQNCIKTSPCNMDAKMMSVAQEQEEHAEAAYQAAMQKVAQYEAGLFQYEQAVDRACGRR